MESPYLVCKTQKVIEFYQKHPNLDFESMNIIFTSMMESLTMDMNSSLNTNIATQLLTHIQGLQSQVAVVSENVVRIQSDTLLNFNLKMTEFKRDHIADMQMILSNNSTNTIEKLSPLIREYNSILLDKTHLMLNELVPKNNESLTRQIQEIMKCFHTSISEETNHLLKSNLDQESLSDFMAKLDHKFSTAQTSSQQIINAIVTSSEHRLDSRISEIRSSTEQNIHDLKTMSSSSQSSQMLLQTNVSDLLKKMEVSSIKGKCSENVLFHILQSLYPTAQIDVVGQEKETGDIMLIRKNKPTILIENKNWSKTVVQEEVKKFIRDAEIQNCCGLFLSQNNGIAHKENFEININNGNVLLYVHEVNNDAEKIKMAIDIIDNFKIKLDEINLSDGNEITIDKDVLDDINKEYQSFIIQKIAQIKTIKDYSSKMLKQIDDIQFPNLEKFLATRYAFSSTTCISCDVCGFIAKNQSSMSAHRRGCKKTDDCDVSSIGVELVAQPIQQIPVIKSAKPRVPK